MNAAGVQATVDRVLEARADVAALACVDVETGMVIGNAAREDDLEECLDAAAACAAELVTSPRVGEDGETEHVASDETFFVGTRWMHALVRAPQRRELVVVGIGPAAGNLALLLSCTRDVARAVGG